MRGLWTWPSEPSQQDDALRKVAREDELGAILKTLAANPEGLSNAQLDRHLNNNSQWRTLPHVEELIALGFVRYKIQFFGEAGKYELTDLGSSALSKIRAIR